jgi:hypothetical protein
MSTNDAMQAVERMQAQLETMGEQGDWLDRLLFQVVPEPTEPELLRRRLTIAPRCVLRRSIAVRSGRVAVDC